ncbi:class D sortase [Marinicrinis lubricantis]|uniref:Class D sortase n=1 Tax=Marinicrinis lubricantis TaxID=2086470 RepID=A0ABW1IV29_9BACL
MRTIRRYGIPILLFCLGLGLLCYPKLSEMYYTDKQQDLIEEWQKSFANIAAAQDDVRDADVEHILPTPLSIAMKEHNGSELATAVQLPDGVESMLIIDKIDLQLPVLRGATAQNLNTSLASIEATGIPGEIGNYAVAGHRNRTYGRNFNRLDELEIGDAIQVNTGVEQFEYIVMEKFLVEPDEVWVLEPNGTDKEITLITCDPIENATHRLIVKGIMQSDNLES